MLSCVRIWFLREFLTGKKGYILGREKYDFKWKIIAVFLILTTSTVYAEKVKTYYDDAKRGWFWFEDPVKKKKERKKPKKKLVINPEILRPEYLSNLTAEEFKKLYKRVKGIAVMNPTEQNIGAVVYLTDFMRRKSLNFAYAYQDYILQHPEYDMNRVSGTTSWSWRKASLEKEERMKRYIKLNADNIGLYFFASSGCSFCEEQSKILQFLSIDYGIAIKTVTKDACIPDYPNCSVNPVMFDRFRVEITPTIVLVYRDENNQPKFAKIASGLVTEERLFKRIYLYLRYFKTGKWEINSLFDDGELQKEETFRGEKWSGKRK